MRRVVGVFALAASVVQAMAGTCPPWFRWTSTSVAAVLVWCGVAVGMAVAAGAPMPLIGAVWASSNNTNPRPAPTFTVATGMWTLLAFAVARVGGLLAQDRPERAPCLGQPADAAVHQLPDGTDTPPPGLAVAAVETSAETRVAAEPPDRISDP